MRDPVRQAISVCPICAQGAPLDVIATFEHLWVTAQRDAPLPDYVCLVSRLHVREPYELPDAARAGFWREVDAIAAAVDRELRPAKLNYEIHGNTMEHLHLHLFPRRPGDRFEGGPIDPRRTAPRSDEQLDRLRRIVRSVTVAGESATADDRVDVLVLSGPAGVGKSSVAYEIGRLLEPDGLSLAIIDTDELDRVQPVPADLEALSEANLAAVWSAFRSRGVRRLVLVGVYLDRPAILGSVRRAVPGARLTLVRLMADGPTLAARIERREIGSGRADQLRRTARQVAAMAADQRPEVHTVATDCVTTVEVARRTVEVWRAASTH